MESTANKTKPKIAVIPPRKFKEDEGIETKEDATVIESTEEQQKAFKNAVFKEENLRTDSEYHTASEFIPEFNSDNEPPEDKLTLPKMILKTDKIRLYKKILKIGKGLLMPAKYDLIKYKVKETLAECMETSVLNQVEVMEGQMGVTILDEELIDCLSNLKEGERSSFKVEEVGFDEKKRRVVKRERHLLAEMLWWQTVIDLRGDRHLMKAVIERGVGQKRFTPVDEVTFSCQIYQGQAMIKQYNLVDCLIESLDDPLPSTVVELLESSKAEESFSCKVDYEFFEENETNVELKRLVSQRREDLRVEMHVKSIVERQDLFKDGSVIKKVTKKSYSTAAPDDNSRLYFDYRVTDRHGNLILTSKLYSASQQTIPRNDSRSR